MLRCQGPRFGSDFERLESREVPAIVMFAVNVTDDTPFASFGYNPFTGQNAPLDSHGNTSLRAVVDYADANPLTGAHCKTTTMSACQAEQ